MSRLSNQGRGGGGFILETRLERLGALVVSCETVDTRLDQDKTELGVLVLAVSLEVLAHANSLLDQAVQIFWDGRGKRCYT